MMNDGFTDILVLVLAALLLAAAVMDLKTRRIPNWLCIAVGVMAPLFWWSSATPFYPDALERLSIAYLVFLLFFGIFVLGGMGGGDVKLGAALVMWFSPLVTLTFLVITSIVGAVVSILAWIFHHKIQKRSGKTQVPYGVAIAFSGLAILTQRFLNQFA